MESETFTKKYNFRLPDRTIERLDKLVENGTVRNRTEAIIYIIDVCEGLFSKVEHIDSDRENIKNEMKKLTAKSLELQKSIEELEKKAEYYIDKNQKEENK